MTAMMDTLLEGPLRGGPVDAGCVVAWGTCEICGPVMTRAFGVEPLMCGPAMTRAFGVEPLWLFVMDFVMGAVMLVVAVVGGRDGVG
jgi:hypothetical protein